MNVPKLAAQTGSSRQTTPHPKSLDHTRPHQVTIFALPKPFETTQARINQANALLSWKSLEPAVQVVLFGDDLGIEDFAIKHGLIYGGALRRNQFGTPLLSDAFRRVHELTESPLIMYSNADVIYSSDLLKAAEEMQSHFSEQPFVAFGRRVDVPIDKQLDFSDASVWSWLRSQVKSQGRLSPIVCKEYFLFSRGVYDSIPDFAVGRGNWDNWMIHQARENNLPVVNASAAIEAIHQRHDYRHLKTSRLGCYVTCPEARENQRLAGGRHLVHGSSGTWTMSNQGIVRNPDPKSNQDFWGDLSHFFRMILSLPFQR
ncbi:MAG: hypothetical protein R3C03_14000 [Pirellulaceae bacterium]